MTEARAEQLAEVRLLGLPLELLAEAQEQSDELRREFTHVAEADSDSVPARLNALSEQLRGDYGAFTSAVQEDIDAATARGEKTIDVTFNVPPQVADAARGLWAMLEEADEYCSTGDLLTLAPSPDILALRTWYLGQFIDQIEGAQPVPYEEFAAAHRF